ncbi:hypothetical protein VOLCADRAFT_104097 [Volvox carteri f. nagariensis]|uniref:Uncharacterized protein n=1 Tax=Volvox carteri f. nagariensis TaxID=3068 RepID=D8TR83_VOLCA|nr:uncharacterized protein VOLCADRAFT_104097 [Volvox carteri f. nagariensis]EFJ49952.1 hypothetical protein VOLCADRAFT_104097 [Volvox carteri f. nagariensis]|eukprot:XP_002949017.1 hypothetical protein VOLCADRAFT_104097 [Volvox carteri f. nagariensis]
MRTPDRIDSVEFTNNSTQTLKVATFYYNTTGTTGKSLLVEATIQPGKRYLFPAKTQTITTYTVVIPVVQVVVRLANGLSVLVNPTVRGVVGMLKVVAGPGPSDGPSGEVTLTQTATQT